MSSLILGLIDSIGVLHGTARMFESAHRVEPIC